ncbi:rRNA maturation RNase YbeY [Stella sp.]|uniref:rRNA maturation RNase YbeY n=1 Tax=Stella sp. TaxID=2912054 RepID=UPI0035AF84C5
MGVRIGIRIPHRAWRDALPDPRGVVRRAVRAALAVAPPPAGDTEMAVALADDALLRRLNHEYRGLDKPTNVLSFAAGEAALLGDVAIAYETTAAEAAAAGKSLGDHLSHLVVHGTLHLLGFDHETMEDAAEMEPLEVRALAALGIADPYEEAA